MAEGDGPVEVQPQEQFRVGLEDPNENDMRNAVLLVDPRRKEFLAVLEPGVQNSYAVLYARAERWIGFARRSGQAARKRNDADAGKWLQLEHHWQTSVTWLDSNLVMSGSTRGKRAEQLADVLSGSRDPPSVGGTQVVVPQVYQPGQQQAQKPRFFGR